MTVLNALGLVPPGQHNKPQAEPTPQEPESVEPTQPSNESANTPQQQPQSAPVVESAASEPVRIERQPPPPVAEIALASPAPAPDDAQLRAEAEAAVERARAANIVERVESTAAGWATSQVTPLSDLSGANQSEETALNATTPGSAPSQDGGLDKSV